ncbi:unnamed protein product [Linum trigynum]|uniref:F-box domain-containing protein n=1 Tax=Linum trigynum TaxID=586398 RepID=A0AAV2FII3_9ROSI
MQRMVRSLTDLEEAEKFRSSGEGEDGEEDRISQLPDSIIHAILHQLNSPEEAARTSSISTRWRRLWHSYPFVDFKLSGENQSQFPSFVASTCKRLLGLLNSDSDHSTTSGFAAVATMIQDFNISVHLDYQNDDLDRLLLLFTTSPALSPAKFVLQGRCSLPVMNWSRTKHISLFGCELIALPTAASVSLGSLEYLCLVQVSISEQLLETFLANAPRLESLTVFDIDGIEKLEVVSSPRLHDLNLGDIVYSPGWMGHPRQGRIRRLKISTPDLKVLQIQSGLEELEIDAPNLVSLSWNVYPGEPLAKVNVINLASDCQSTVEVEYFGEFKPQKLRLSLSTTFAQFHRLALSFELFLSTLSVPLDISQIECSFPPRKVDRVECRNHTGTVYEAAALSDRLFWACRPKFVVITNCRRTCLIAEYMCREYLKPASPDNANAATFWRRHLKEMKIENDATGEMMEIFEDMISSITKQQKIRFMLTWYENIVC